MDAPSLEAFKARLDVALGSLVCWLATLHIAGGWNWMSTAVLSNPGHSRILFPYTEQPFPSPAGSSPPHPPTHPHPTQTHFSHHPQPTPQSSFPTEEQLPAAPPTPLPQPGPTAPHRPPQAGPAPRRTHQPSTRPLVTRKQTNTTVM